MPEHLRNIKVEWLYTIFLNEREVRIARCFAYHIHRRTFAFGNATHVVEILLVYQQAHTFLRFVGDDFLCTQRFIANRQLVHVYSAATVFYQLAQTVQVSCRTVVVNRNNRVFVFFYQRTNKIVGTLLHFGIGTLDSIQLDSA